MFTYKEVSKMAVSGNPATTQADHTTAPVFSLRYGKVTWGLCEASDGNQEVLVKTRTL